MVYITMMLIILTKVSMINNLRKKVQILFLLLNKKDQDQMKKGLISIEYFLQR